MPKGSGKVGLGTLFPGAKLTIDDPNASNGLHISVGQNNNNAELLTIDQWNGGRRLTITPLELNFQGDIKAPSGTMLSQNIRCNTLGTISGLGQLQINNACNFNNSSIAGLFSISAQSGPLNIYSELAMNNNDITGVNSLTVGTLNYTTLNPPITPSGNLSKFFFNRLTPVSLNAQANTRTQIPIGGTAGLDYVILTNTNFFISGNEIYYGGFATKNFYIQVSFAWQSGASSSNIGIELVRNTTPISQGRWNTIASSNLDIQDFNFITLENADSLSFFYSANNAIGSLVANSQTNLTSTTKPIQIWITEI